MKMLQAGLRPSSFFQSLALSLITIFLIAGCAGNTPGTGPKEPENRWLTTAQSLQQRAAQAYANGDLSSAAAGFEAAAKMYESLALPEPQAIARLSAARALADAGQNPQALALVQQVLADAAQLSAATQITAHGRAAALLLGLPSAASTVASSASPAATHLQIAQQLCANTCAQQAALWVLRARLALAQGDAPAAINAATQAMQDAAQRPQALAVRAQAQLASRAPAQAIEDATQALQAQRDLGNPAAVQWQLQVLAQAHRALGQTEQAQRFEAQAQRAQAARQAVERGLP
jgi:tetratricopeptide (TPR) repeat protein